MADPDASDPDQRYWHEAEFDEADLPDFLAYVARHGTSRGYERPPEERDTSLSSTPGRACKTAWYCRDQGGAGPGCEVHCMFTHDAEKERPNCFGFNSGMSVLREGDFLFTPMQLTCLQCRHFLACGEETDRRFRCGTCGEELET